MKVIGVFNSVFKVLEAAEQALCGLYSGDEDKMLKNIDLRSVCTSLC